MKYFTGQANSIEELKKEYKKLAMANHPDRGGSTQAMQEINSEYEILSTKLDSKADFKGYMAIINDLINHNITIEIIGTWIWISGETTPIKDKLKSLGFQWAPKKFMWYKKPEGTITSSRGKKSIDEIRATYGSQVVKQNKRTNKSIA